MTHTASVLKPVIALPLSSVADSRKETKKNRASERKAAIERTGKWLTVLTKALYWQFLPGRMQNVQKERVVYILEGWLL